MYLVIMYEAHGDKRHFDNRFAGEEEEDVTLAEGCSSRTAQVAESGRPSSFGRGN